MLRSLVALRSPAVVWFSAGCSPDSAFCWFFALDSAKGPRKFTHCNDKETPAAESGSARFTLVELGLPLLSEGVIVVVGLISLNVLVC